MKPSFFASYKVLIEISTILSGLYNLIIIPLFTFFCSIFSKSKKEPYGSFLVIKFRPVLHNTEGHTYAYLHTSFTNYLFFCLLFPHNVLINNLPVRVTVPLTFYCLQLSQVQPLGGQVLQYHSSLYHYFLYQGVSPLLFYKL